MEENQSKNTRKRERQGRDDWGGQEVKGQNEVDVPSKVYKKTVVKTN